MSDEQTPKRRRWIMPLLLVSLAFNLLIVDLDHFKQVNDQHGHSAGDEVLREVAKRLRENLRAFDLVSRHGGEEFLVVLPDAGEAEASRTAERLRTAISKAPVEVDGASIPVTASIGVALEQNTEHGLRLKGTFECADSASDGLLGRVFDAADTALYDAKNAGRNRVVFNAA